ncbi:MAG: BtpA/SgcQ family protein [Phycisphaerae bacterium]|nr:BtpA/SgcQ family protein [Phycisphaerae bacterium]
MGVVRKTFLTDREGPALIGMVHVGALPGTPRAASGVASLVQSAADEARALADAGVDAVLLENMHDTPYLNRRVGPEIVAAMTAVCCAVRAVVRLPLGVQVLAGANRAAMAVAHAAGFQFIRAEGFVFSHVADEGLMPEADAGRLLRFRRRIGADGIAVFADVKKKHAAHAMTADVSLAETAQAAEFFGADGVVVTGAATGLPTSPADVEAVRGAVTIPVLVGSGVTPDNAAPMAAHAGGFIVGSFMKRDGVWSNSVDPKRAAAMVAAIRLPRG